MVFICFGWTCQPNELPELSNIILNYSARLRCPAFLHFLSTCESAPVRPSVNPPGIPRRAAQHGKAPTAARKVHRREGLGPVGWLDASVGRSER